MKDGQFGNTSRACVKTVSSSVRQLSKLSMFFCDSLRAAHGSSIRNGHTGAKESSNIRLPLPSRNHSWRGHLFSTDNNLIDPCIESMQSGNKPRIYEVVRIRLVVQEDDRQFSATK
jgi:hypothetical protein